MDKKTTDLLQRRVKLGAKMDVLINQLADLHQELQQVHGGIAKAINQNEQKDLNQTLPNIISNFSGIMAKRLERAIDARPSPSEKSFEEAFTQENISIVARLEAPIRPKESLLDQNRRLGLKVHEGRG